MTRRLKALNLNLSGAAAMPPRFFHQLLAKQPLLGYSGEIDGEVYMGLDMYLDGKRYFMDRPTSEAGKATLKAEVYELGYWRKHPNLHGYIVQTFADRVDDCREISLNSESLAQIIEAVRAKELPHTIGFFFGVSDGSEDEMAEDVMILQGALEWLLVKEEGVFRSVCYRASW